MNVNQTSSEHNEVIINKEKIAEKYFSDHRDVIPENFDQARKSQAALKKELKIVLPKEQKTLEI